jgi:hypothetical protein
LTITVLNCYKPFSADLSQIAERLINPAKAIKSIRPPL